MKDSKYRELLHKICADDTRYDIHAYDFVSAAVSFTVRKIEEEEQGRGRHVSGAELIRGALHFAVERYGFLAPEVFEYWHLIRGADLGALVFRLIGVGILSASENDHIEDFDCAENLPSELRRMTRVAPSVPMPNPPKIA